MYKVKCNDCEYTLWTIDDVMECVCGVIRPPLHSGNLGTSYEPNAKRHSSYRVEMRPCKRCKNCLSTSDYDWPIKYYCLGEFSHENTPSTRLQVHIGGKMLCDCKYAEEACINELKAWKLARVKYADDDSKLFSIRMWLENRMMRVIDNKWDKWADGREVDGRGTCDNWEKRDERK